MGNTDRSIKWWVLAKAALAVGCLYLGVKALESYFIYSLAADGARIKSDNVQYAVAYRGCLFALGIFVFIQILGGELLRGIILPRQLEPWGLRLRSLLLFSGCFVAITLTAVAAIVWLH